MIKRCVEISTGPTHLSLRLGQLVISREREEVATVPIEDLGVLIVDEGKTTYTHAALTALLANNVAVVLCGPDHHPAGMMLPLEVNSTQSVAIAAQASASAALKGRLWREIVRGKILNQAALIEELGREAGALKALARRVKAGDPENLEAQAAQRYWPMLMGPGFRRNREGLPPNNLLNYGYAIVRAAVARAICGAGLHPSLGIHHRNKYDAFTLADDLMEPLRPVADAVVRGLWEKGEGDLSRPVRAELLGLVARPVQWKDERSPLLVALARYVASVREALQGKGNLPEIPAPIPVEETPQ
jgi:CRISP-associated protein Cas1